MRKINLKLPFSDERLENVGEFSKFALALLVMVMQLQSHIEESGHGKEFTENLERKKRLLRKVAIEFAGW